MSVLVVSSFRPLTRARMGFIKSSLNPVRAEFDPRDGGEA